MWPNEFAALIISLFPAGISEQITGLITIGAVFVWFVMMLAPIVAPIAWIAQRKERRAQ